MNDNGGLYFIVGGLAVIAIIGVILFSNGTLGGHHGSGTSTTGGSTTIERTVAMAALGVLMSYVLEAWGDMGTQSMNCTLLAAAAIAVSGKLATTTGALPRGIPLFGAPARLGGVGTL